MDQPVTTRLPKDLIRDLKREAKAGKPKLKMYEVFQEALRLWLNHREKRKEAA